MDNEMRRVEQETHRADRDVLALSEVVHKLQEQLKEDMSSLISENKKFRIQPVDSTMMQSL